MVPLPDLMLWILTTLAEAFVVCVFLIRGLFRKFLFLNFYLVLSVATSIGRYAAFSHFGYASFDYAYFYYFSEALVTISLFLSICELSMRLVGTKMPHRRVVLLSSVALLVASAWSSLSVTSSSASRAMTRFVFELSQNILFECGLAIVLLWAWKLRNDPEDRLAARFVSVLTVYFSLFFLAYGAGQLAPASGLQSLFPMMGAWLPLGCGFALVSREQPRRTKQ